MVESLLDGSDKDIFLDWAVRDDGFDVGNATDPCGDVADGAVTNEACVEESFTSSG
jgi:hypothetical protein